MQAPADVTHLHFKVHWGLAALEGHGPGEWITL